MMTTDKELFSINGSYIMKEPEHRKCINIAIIDVYVHTDKSTSVEPLKIGTYRTTCKIKTCYYKENLWYMYI